MDCKTGKKRTRSGPRDDPRRVVCTFLAAPDADARLRRVYEILLGHSRLRSEQDVDRTCGG
jgi:hypothetical protein